MGSSFSINGWTCIWFSIFLLTIPLNWSLSLFSAAFFHELCHAAVVYLCGGRILKIVVNPNGIRMCVGPMPPFQELLCAIAGPAGSFFLTLFFRHFPELALCGYVHGMFNLIPVYPLDGGRCLKCLCQMFFGDDITEKAFCIWQSICLFLICIAGIFCSLFLKMGMIPLIASVYLGYRGFSGKYSCKDSFLAVQ